MKGPFVKQTLYLKRNKKFKCFIHLAHNLACCHLVWKDGSRYHTLIVEKVTNMQKKWRTWYDMKNFLVKLFIQGCIKTIIYRLLMFDFTECSHIFEIQLNMKEKDCKCANNMKKWNVIWVKKIFDIDFLAPQLFLTKSS